MTEPLEGELTQLLQERADAAQPPPVPLGMLRREGQAARDRSRRRPVLAAAAAAGILVLGLTAVTSLVSPSSKNTPTDSPRSEQPARPQVPYIHQGLLRVGSDEIPTQADQVLAEAGSVLVTDHYYSQSKGESSRSHALLGGELTPLPILEDAVVSLSQGGNLVAALSHPTPDSTRISVYRFPETDHERHIDLQIPGSCCHPGAVGFLGWDGDDRLFYNVDWLDEPFVWDVLTEGSAPVPVRGAPGPVIQVDLAGAVTVPGQYGEVTERVLGDVDESGVFRERMTIPAAEPTETIRWSPTGDFAAYRGKTAPVIDTVEDGQAGVPLNLGARKYSHFVAFEPDGNALLVTWTRNRHELMRCEPTGDCAPVLELGGVNALDDWAFAEHG